MTEEEIEAAEKAWGKETLNRERKEEVTIRISKYDLHVIQEALDYQFLYIRDDAIESAEDSVRHNYGFMRDCLKVDEEYLHNLMTKLE